MDALLPYIQVACPEKKKKNVIYNYTFVPLFKNMGQ